MPCLTLQGELDEALTLSSYSVYQLYNCLDSAVTAQLLPEMQTLLNSNTARTYERELAVQALCLEMSTEGFPIDQLALADYCYRLERQAEKALRILHQFCDAIGCRHINPNSTKDVPWLFYEFFGIPPIYTYDRQTKQRKLSADIKALEKIRAAYPTAGHFVNAILAYRENRKLASVFKRGLEPETRYLRCNFSPSGTDTGRLSSQQNVYGRGTNAQNLTDSARQVISAPDGYCILNFDKKTAESIAVGYISGCKAYIDACLSGDVHTSAAKLVWPHLPWTGNLKQDKEIAESPFYRMFSYRDMAKRGGHGTNYYGTPATMAMHLNVETSFVEAFQRAYFEAFPEISEWHLRVIAQIQQQGIIVNALGRERRFWGRPDDSATHRAAIAHDPQSLVADEMNLSLIQVQSWLLRECRDAKTYIRSAKNKRLYPLRANLRAQVHDAGVFIVPIEAAKELAPKIQERLIHPVDFGSLGEMRIPTDCLIGKTWCKQPHSPGPHTKWEKLGLRSFKPDLDLSFLRS